MRRLMVIFGALAILCTIATPAAATDGSLPGGTSLSVDITAPTEGGFVIAGQAVTLTGTATVGEGAVVKDTSIAYILDISGSTANDSGVNCDNVTGSDTILACEIAAIKRVNNLAADARSTVLNSGVGAFNGSYSTLDVDPATGKQLLTAPGANINSAIGAAGLTPGGGTNFDSGLTAANEILSSTTPPPASNKVVVFLTDGAGTSSTPPTLPSGTTVKAFAIAGAGCVPPLTNISNSCKAVSDLAVLDDVINEALGSTIDSLSYSIDGDDKSFKSGDLTPPQVDGPGSVDINANIGPLSAGPHTLCVTANGTDAGGSDSVTDCVNVTSVQSTVDCSLPGTNCQTTATDGSKSTATVVGTGFNKQLGVNAATSNPGECGGQDCVTGYDVIFDDTGDTGAVIEMTVISSVANFVHPSKAAVYIDDTQVTTSCTSTSTLPCQRIMKIANYDHCAAYTNPFWNLICKIFFPKFQTKYFVKFDADPRLRFR